MGWPLHVVHATGPSATATTLTEVGYLSTGIRVPVGEAIAEIDELAPGGIAVLEGWSPGIQAVARLVDHDDLPLALSAGGGEAATFLWQPASDACVLSVFRDGRPYRRLVRVDGDIVVDEGPALPIEATVDWSDADAALLAVAVALVGDPIGTEPWLARTTLVHRRRRRR